MVFPLWLKCILEENCFALSGSVNFNMMVFSRDSSANSSNVNAVFRFPSERWGSLDFSPLEWDMTVKGRLVWVFFP